MSVDAARKSACATRVFNGVTMGLRPTKGNEDALWGRQSCLQPPFRRLVSKVSRLKAGCSQDWLPHNMPASSTERFQIPLVDGIAPLRSRFGIKY